MPREIFNSVSTTHEILLDQSVVFCHDEGEFLLLQIDNYVFELIHADKCPTKENLSIAIGISI